MDSTFNVAIINVLWQIVASKRFDPNAEDTKRMMALLNMQFKAGFKAFNFFPFLRHSPLIMNLIKLKGTAKLTAVGKRVCLKDSKYNSGVNICLDFLNCSLQPENSSPPTVG